MFSFIILSLYYWIHTNLIFLELPGKLNLLKNYEVTLFISSKHVCLKVHWCDIIIVCLKSGSLRAEQRQGFWCKLDHFTHLSLYSSMALTSISLCNHHCYRSFVDALCKTEELSIFPGLLRVFIINVLNFVKCYFFCICEIIVCFSFILLI